MTKREKIVDAIKFHPIKIKVDRDVPVNEVWWVDMDGKIIQKTKVEPEEQPEVPEWEKDWNNLLGTCPKYDNADFDVAFDISSDFAGGLKSFIRREFEKIRAEIKDAEPKGFDCDIASAYYRLRDAINEAFAKRGVKA